VHALACGICEGDVFHYRASRGSQTETVLGHEGVGRVAALGPGVAGLAVGQMVATLAGPYADYYLSPADVVAEVPPSVAPALALGEPIACCVHAADRFGIHLGDRVAVIGSGFMGLMCLQLARLQGAAELCVLEPLAWRREMALQLGADVALDPGQDAAAMAAELGEFDVVIEATGVPGGLELAGELVRQHGRIVIIGYHQTEDGRRNVNMKMWNFKAIDVINGHVRRDGEKMVAMRAGLALLASGRLQTAPLVTTYPLSAAQAAFEDLASRKPGLYKAVLLPGD
jgi:threonine dehydrogenase-like Zn-dependent dehydrogenase